MNPNRALLFLIASVFVTGATITACGKSIHTQPDAQPPLNPSVPSPSVDRSTLPPQPSANESAAFWKFWGDGNAEVDSYKTTQSRYGELREGYSVLVFVTEEISRTSRIKVESDAIPKDDRIPVLKLNRVLKFPTGIYDYSMLTSTFDAIGAEFGNHPWQAMKISNTTQEWCGSFFGMWRTNNDALYYTRYSYFQSEGDMDNVRYNLPNDEWEYEDNLPILIRELDGAWMKTGDAKNVMLMPSFQHQRFTHDSIAFLPATIKKEDGGDIKIGSKTCPATTHWTWLYTDGKTKVSEEYWTEADYPHRIVQWKSSDGSSGELLVSERQPYWSQHDNAHANMRKEFEIPEN